ncbi:MAG: zinc-ribbon domain-containing protein [Methanoregula sp.]
MGYPDLKSDESIVLTAQHVKVKSVPFELVLTNRRLIIIDSEKNVVPTQQISLVTIRNVTASENAIRDPVITLTILTETADTREMALTFVRQTAGERRRESDEWVKALRKNIAEAAMYPPDIVATPQVPDESRQEHPGSPGIKKKIDAPRPMKKIVVDTSHLPPKPVETTSLPEGSFCGRCGNRIPPGSTFCNRCGTKVAGSADETIISAPTGQVTPVSSVTGSGDRKGRPIEQIIHSIEPLIADSVPRTETPPAIPEPVSVPSAEPASSAEPSTEAPAGSEPASEPASESASGGLVIPPMPTFPTIPPVPEAPRKKPFKVIAAAIIVIVIIAIVAVGGFVLIKNMHTNTTVVQPITTAIPTTQTAVPTPTPTMAVTTVIPTVLQTPATSVPQTGVWVEITYDQTYSGSVGLPGDQVQVSDTGDHYYRIPTENGVVAVSVQKNDGSADELKVNLFNNGILVKTGSTTIPYGNVDMQVSLSVPTPTATLPLKSNPTANKTASTT